MNLVFKMILLGIRVSRTELIWLFVIKSNPLNYKSWDVLPKQPIRQTSRASPGESRSAKDLLNLLVFRSLLEEKEEN